MVKSAPKNCDPPELQDTVTTTWAHTGTTRYSHNNVGPHRNPLLSSSFQISHALNVMTLSCLQIPDT